MGTRLNVVAVMGKFVLAIVHPIFLALDWMPFLVWTDIGYAHGIDVAIAPLVAFLQCA